MHTSSPPLPPASGEVAPVFKFTCDQIQILRGIKFTFTYDHVITPSSLLPLEDISQHISTHYSLHCPQQRTFIVPSFPHCRHQQLLFPTAVEQRGAHSPRFSLSLSLLSLSLLFLFLSPSLSLSLSLPLSFSLPLSLSPPSLSLSLCWKKHEELRSGSPSLTLFLLSPLRRRVRVSVPSLSFRVLVGEVL